MPVLAWLRPAVQLRPLLRHRLAKPVVFVLSLLPFCWLFYGALFDQLGANPAEALVRATGDWTLRFL
ncbi:MAG TPA: sulfoxide reductase heme-binding subunit YedZ, partial [Rhodoferax sp.]